MKLVAILHTDERPGQTKYHVRLTEEERAQLKTLTTAGRVAARRRLHAHIVLAADAGAEGPALSDTAITAALGVGLRTMGRVRQRYVEEGLDAAVTPRPHHNHHKRKVDGHAEAHLIALACSPPPAGSAHWTLRLLAAELVALDLGIDISHETVRRALKKKRTEAVAGEGVVHPTGGERRVCLSHGRCLGGVSSALRPALSAGVHG